MDIGICGFGYSGSGAVFDLLKEYDELELVHSSELFITYFPDGLCDLYHHTCEYHSKFFNSDTAIRRFLTLCKNYGNLYGWNRARKKAFYDLSRNFVDNITQCRYKGYWANKLLTMGELEKTYYYRFGSRINRLLGKEIVVPNRFINFSYNPQNFIESARIYITQVKKMLGYKEDCKCVFNQPFAADNPEASFPFFSNPKAIIVKRDPRDIYIMVKHFIKRNASWIPYNDVNAFVVFYREQCKNAQSRENVLSVNFEDLIYKYDNTVNDIEDFLSLKGNSNKGKFFNPNDSVNNTRLFEKFSDYRDDVKIIEKELPEFLYNFDDVERIDNSGSCFWD